METQQTRPHWSKEADYSRVPFFIRRMNTRGRITVAEVPSASLPLVGFLYLTEGEVLAEVDGIQFLCESGHLLLIPEGHPLGVLVRRGRLRRGTVQHAGPFLRKGRCRFSA